MEQLAAFAVSAGASAPNIKRARPAFGPPPSTSSDLLSLCRNIMELHYGPQNTATACIHTCMYTCVLCTWVRPCTYACVSTGPQTTTVRVLQKLRSIKTLLPFISVLILVFNLANSTQIAALSPVILTPSPWRSLSHSLPTDCEKTRVCRLVFGTRCCCGGSLRWAPRPPGPFHAVAGRGAALKGALSQSNRFSGAEKCQF